MAYAKALEALADPTRRAVLDQLRGGGRSVTEIASHLPVSRPAVSQHLKVLKDAGLVRDERRGAARIYRIHAPALVELRTWLDSFWGEALDNFKTYAEGEDERR